MILVLEILFLLSGVWAIFTGKLPAFLFGGDKYQIEGIAIRILGVVLLLPLPVAFIGAAPTPHACWPDWRHSSGWPWPDVWC